MEVYFGNLWSKQRKSDMQPGTEISVDKHFTYAGFQWVCPKIYLCKEGIVLDLCRRYDASEFQAFYDKWVDRIDALSVYEQDRIARENPMNFLCDLRLYLDGKRLEGGGWSGTGWQPDFHEQKDSISEKLVEEYALSRDFGWYIYRAQFPYSREDCVSLKKTEEPLKRLILQVAARKEKIYFDTEITTEADCAPFSVELRHPLTGKSHQFFVGACSAETFDGMPAQFTREMKLPEKNCVLVYGVAPEFPAEDFFSVEDCAPSDSPIPKKMGKDAKAAATIGIIGSTDGPSSIFLAGKIGGKTEFLEKAKAAGADREMHWKTVCSSLTFEPVKEVTWKCSVQAAPFEPLKIPLYILPSST